MSALWVLPVVVLAAGAVALAVAARRLADAVAGLRAEGDELRRLAVDAESARAEAGAAWRRGVELADVRARWSDTGGAATGR